MTVEATDASGNSVSTETDDEVTVDTTPPEISTFTVGDESELILGWFEVEYVEVFEIQWTATDANPGAATVFVNESSVVQESYSGFTGEETYQYVREGEWDGREHTITIVATD